MEPSKFRMGGSIMGINDLTNIIDYNNGGVVGKTNDPATGSNSEKIDTFSSPGTWTGGTGFTAGNVAVLVVAGGGGAGQRKGGGGGAGGVRNIAAHPAPGSPVAVTVGSGGAGGTVPSSKGISGGTSTFATAAILSFPFRLINLTP